MRLEASIQRSDMSLDQVRLLRTALARMAAGKSLQRNNISAHTKNTIRALSLGVNLPAKPSQPLTVAEAELRFNQSEKKYLNGLKRLKSN